MDELLVFTAGILRTIFQVGVNFIESSNLDGRIRIVLQLLEGRWMSWIFFGVFPSYLQCYASWNPLELRKISKVTFFHLYVRSDVFFCACDRFT